MALPVSSSFLAAQEADANQPAYQVQLVLGDYANVNQGSAASSSGDFSTDYPAAGAIDGDRTELNVGPASGADNGVGQSSWKSSGQPDTGASVWLVIDFGQMRTINRIKLYHRYGHGITSYNLEYWDGASWNDLGGLAVGGGYGNDPYGSSPYGGGLLTTFSGSGTLDTIDFTQVSASKLRLTPLTTQVTHDYAEVVALEVYRLVDISSRVMGVNVDRQRDYRLQNNLAATCQIDVDNSDRFFSPSHTPTAAEVSSGFVNTELRPGLGIIVKQGFSYGGGVTELASSFVGTLDAVTVKSLARQATLTGRDGMKGLLNLTVSTALKTSQDITLSLQYLLNLANVSNYEMSLDTTTIVLDYFFVDDNSITTAIQALVQSCGDAGFYFDENGIAQFAMWLNTVPQQKLISSQADFQGGLTLTNIDTTGNPGAICHEWFLIDDFSSTLSGWTLSGTSVISAGQLHIGGVGGSGTSGQSLTTQTINTGSVGTWELDIVNALANTVTYPAPVAMWFDFMVDGSGNKYSINCGTGSGTNFNFSLYVNRTTSLGTYAVNMPSGFVSTTVRVTRDTSGVMNVYLNGTLRITGTDTSITRSVEMVLADASPASSNPEWVIDNIHYAAGPTTAAYSTPTSVWESAVIDMSAAISGLGLLQATLLTPAGTSASWFTATSADGITFDPYVSATVGSTIASTMRRYIKVKVTFSCPIDSGITNKMNVNTPTVYDITVNWTTGAGRAKYPVSASQTIRYDGTMIELEQELSDSLSGDTSILNDAQVSSAPLVLSGNSTDTRWQGTHGTPATAISVTNPLSVGPGTYTYQPIITGGMDTSLMSGANPAAVAITFAGGAAGSWVVSVINPTRPIVTITVTSPGTITDFRMVGKQFVNSTTPYAVEVSDALSIALYQKRTLKLQNDYIINSGVALAIANRLIANYKSPVNYIPKLTVRPKYSAQLGDRWTLVDYSTDISADYLVVGLTHATSGSITDARADTGAVLLKI